MIDAVDSAYPPNAAQMAAAKASGLGGWWVYLATRSGVNLLHSWSADEIEVVRPLNDRPVAFCSGLDDPVACKTLADVLRVRLCLDVEYGIRGDGPWVQPWLDASAAGLYGNTPVFSGRRAPFYILAGYPTSGDPTGASWNATPRPPGPCGWQWVGTHTEFGIDVDRGTYDDYFKGGEDMTPEQSARLDAVYNYVKHLDEVALPTLSAEVAALKPTLGNVAVEGSLTLKAQP